MSITKFVEDNIFNVDISKFNSNQGQYNNWLGFIWNLKSLGVDKSIVESWARNGDNYNEKNFNDTWNKSNKGHDDINIALKTFEKMCRS